MNENWKAKTNYFYYNSTVFLVFVYLSSCPEIRMNLEKRKINVVSREIQVNSNHFLSLKHKTDLGHRVLFAWARWHTWARWCHRAQDHCPIFQSDIYTLTYLILFKPAFLYFLAQKMACHSTDLKDETSQVSFEESWRQTFGMNFLKWCNLLCTFSSEL